MVKPEKVVSAASIQGDVGKAIRFTGGVYSGKRGWLRNSKTSRGENFTYVLVDVGNGKVKKTIVSNEFVGEWLDQDPTSYAEAILKQHTDIDAMMNSLSAKLAQCHIQQDKDQEDLCLIFAEKLALAVHTQVLRGSKARFRYVRFEV